MRLLLHMPLFCALLLLFASSCNAQSGIVGCLTQSPANYRLNEPDPDYLVTYYFSFHEQPTVDFLAVATTEDVTQFCAANYSGIYSLDATAKISFNLAMQGSPSASSLLVCDSLFNGTFVRFVLEGSVAAISADSQCNTLSFSIGGRLFAFDASSQSLVPSLILLVSALYLF